jgi:signal transduction histidine kinase
MGERDGDKAGSSQRDQTDVSLRVERQRADAGTVEKALVVEDEADEVVRIARRRADEVVQTARDDADREGAPRSPATEAASERERGRADDVLDHERSSADAQLEQERAERRHYLAAFLAVEREATDKNLSGERVHSDTAIAARDDFLANVSHDLRSLLGGLEFNAALLVKRAPEGAAGDLIRRHGETSQRLVARMNRLVNDLLDVVSIEAGALALLPEQVEVEKLLRDTLDAFEPIAAARRITLDADSGALPMHVSLDGGRIQQVLANLVSNAIKFTSAQGHVSIHVRAEGDSIHFAVTDTGIGIPADALQVVFDRFRQVSRDRRGLGLGLHISKFIVEGHGGKMWAESQPGAGSTFHFTLPAGAAP